MFKFVVLCALVAAAAATPGLVAPLAYSGSVVAPATTLVSSYPNNLVYSSPYVSSPLAYSAPWSYPHYIKKRSLAVSSYIAPSYPYATTYASAPFAATYTTPFATSYAAPLATTYSSPLYTTAHLIKKRSAPLIPLPAAYVPSTYAASSPFVASTYAAPAPFAPAVVSTPYYSSPYAHFIKKRSAPFAVAAYGAPAAYSQTSRFDYQSSSPAITYTAYGAAPISYARPIGYSHVF